MPASFTIDRIHLTDALTAVTKAVKTSRATLPALSGVVVDVHDDCVTITGNDLDTYAIALIGSSDSTLEIHDTGAVLLPAKALAGALRGLDRVTVTDDGDKRVAIQSGAVTSQLRTMPLADFPTIDDALADILQRRRSSWHRVDPDAIRSVAVAASGDINRPVLTGVAFTPSGHAVATDSYRLHTASVTDTGCFADTALVPATSVTSVAGWDSLAVASTPNKVTFGGVLVKGPKSKPRITEMLAYMQEIDGKFPTWERLLPDGHETLVSIRDVEELIAVVENIAKGLGAAANTPVTCTFGPDGVSLDAGNREIGDITAEVSTAVVVDGPPVVIAFNPKYLAATLKTFDPSVWATVKLRDGLKPAVFSDGTITSLLMPMRVN